MKKPFYQIEHDFIKDVYKGDKRRQERELNYYNANGFTKSDVVNLESTAARFMLKLFKEYRRQGFSVGEMSQEEWFIIVDSIIYALDEIANETNWNKISDYMSKHSEYRINVVTGEFKHVWDDPDHMEWFDVNAKIIDEKIELGLKNLGTYFRYFKV